MAEAEGGGDPGHVANAAGVRKVFPNGDGVQHLDVTIPAGRIFGLVGPSGSGKTTTVRLLLGVHAPDAGELRVLGQEPINFSAADRQRIGYLPQESLLYPELSLRHNLDFMASIYGMPWRTKVVPTGSARRARARVDEVLEKVGLADRQKRRLAHASGGEKRRLALAAALVHDPELLILDEPTAGIDPVLRQELWRHFTDLRDEGRSVIVTTQYVAEADNCDEVAILVEGRLLHVGTPSELKREAFGDTFEGTRASLDDVFVELIERHRNGGRRDGEPW